MKSQCTASTASRAARFSFFAALLAVLTALLPVTAFAAPSAGGTGQALALSAALRAGRQMASPRSASRAPAMTPGESPAGFVRASNGRAVTDRNVMRSGAIFKSHAASSSNVVPIPGAVQTFDVNNPPPAFRPLIGYGDVAAPTNNSANAPLYLNALTPTNLTPVWSQDETFLIFSSNRTLQGAINNDATGGIGFRYHLWAISVNGGEAFQITTSTGAAGGGEFFPALSSSDNQIAFTSDAQSPGVQNLYSMPFSYSALIGMNNATTFNVSDTTAISSVTAQGVDQFGNPLTGFDNVQRPTFSPVNPGLIVFSAHSVTGTYKGHYHIYYLYTITGGFDPNNRSQPAKLTDGPAEDTDPAYSKDGQFVAFASTAGQVTNQTGPNNNMIGSDPNTSQVITSALDANALRSLFLLGGGGGQGISSPGFGTVPVPLQSTGGRITTAGTDNFGPAWSAVSFNQYTNAPPGFEYLAFARAASRAAPHDIYFLQTVRNINAGGETSRSNEAATTPETINTPIYQVDAGGPNNNNFTVSGPGTTNSSAVGNYVTDGGYLLRNINTNINLINQSQNLTLAFGGAAGPPVTNPFNQTNDPGTPSGIYATSRVGASTYIIPFLTPGANYTLRFHLADPISTAAGQRVFGITINNVPVLVTAPGQNGGTVQTPNIDLIQQAQQSQGQLGGLVTDASTNGTLANATVSVVNYTTGAAVTTTPAPLTTSAATSAAPDGSGNVNYNGTVQGGTFLVTASAPGYESVTQVVIVGSAGFSRADFGLLPASTNGTLAGTVTDTGNNPIPGATVVVTNTANSNLGHNNGNDPASRVGAPLPTGGNGQFSGPLPAGSYNVTVTAQGYATQTQQVTITTGLTSNLAFVLAVPPATGTLSGLVNDAVSKAILAGATVTVRQGGNVVAILNTTAAAPNTPAAPNGDGKAANYTTLLPAGQYQLTFQEYGYSQPTPTPITITAGAFTRADQPLTQPAGSTTAGQNTAVVLTATATATTFSQPVNVVGGTQTVKSGGIVIQFTKSPNDPIVQGIEVLADSNAMTSSGFGAANVSSGTTGPTNLTAIGGDHQVTLTFQPPPSAIPPTGFNLFRSPVTTSSITSVNQTGAGASTEGSTALVTIPNDPSQTTITYTDLNVTNGTEYFYQVSAVFQEQITPEGFPIKTTSTVTPVVANAVIKLNTDDNANETATAGNAYDDTYPTWSPFLSIFSIAYMSNRTVTYNDPITSFPSETAASVGQGGSVAGVTDATGFTGYTVGAAYTGILESQVLNLDPPILLRFSSDEIVHVQVAGPDPINGVPTKSGINPGGRVTFTVRLSDREAGIDNGNSGLLTGGADAARPQVFLQIKDPTSKYQNIPKLEHKVFARDSFYNNQTNHPSSDVTSGTVNNLLSLDDTLLGLPNLRDYYPTYGFNGGYVAPRGAHGGFYQMNGNNLTPSTIFVGKSGGGSNPYSVTAAGANGTTVGGFAPGTDPSLFLAWGSEYECQFINPQFLLSPSQNQTPGDASGADYGTPYWLAGVDDFQSYSGEGKQRPTTNTTNAQGQAQPAEWLQMDISPVQDHRGGVLYTVTWQAPVSATDFYLDVIAFDKAVFPAFPPGTSTYSGKAVNWRIYDNVGGFSTNQSIGNNDILVVSDYALGQKFAATTFNGTRGNLNLVPKLYGAESYFTDVDINLLPDSVYAGYPQVPGQNPPFVPFIHPFIQRTFGFGLQNVVAPRWLNGLGVGSYDDPTIDDGGNVDGVPYVQSQKYSIWRILSRGPVTQSVLNSYLPTKVVQPAVNDTQGPIAYQGLPAATILDAHRCVIWVSPYTGDLLTDPGALDDVGEVAQTLANGMTTAGRPATTTVLRNFVQGGGRLFMTGQDVGSALTLGGTTNNGTGSFLHDVLNATIASTGGGTRTLAATANRITSYPEYDSIGVGFYPAVEGAINQFDSVLTDATFDVNDNNGRPFQSRLELSGADPLDPALQSDSSLSQRIGPAVPSGANLLGEPDTLNPANGATTAITYSNGAVAMVYHDDPYDATKAGALPNGSTGARTVYAGFGLEGLSQDAYSSDSANPDTGFPLNIYVPAVAPRNPRSNILHNVVCFLRTGSFNGIITQTAGGNGQGAGQGVPGVTVYLIPATGVAPPTRATFSATTAADGHYNIVGVEPGTYTVAAYKPGYSRATTNPGVIISVEGDTVATASLTVTPLPPGKISGIVHDTAGTLVPGATLTFQSKDKNYTQTGTSTVNVAADGTNYLIQNVQVDDYTGIAVGPNNPNGKPEYTQASTPDPPFNQDVPVTPNATTTPVNFTLTPILASVTGRVFNTIIGDTAAGALAGATITLTDSTGKVVGTPVKTAADGTYTLTNIPASGAPTTTAYTITATLAGFNTTGNSIKISVFLGDMLTGQDIGLTPSPKGTVSGFVYQPDGITGLPGATVTITSADGTVVLTAVTAADGSYSIANVPPSSYTGSVVGPLNPHGRPQSRAAAPTAPNAAGFAVAAAPPATTVNFVVTLIPPSFAGKITDASTGLALAGVTVTITPVTATGTPVPGGTNTTLTTDAGGNYASGPLTPGTYIVLASLAGYQPNALVGPDPPNTTIITVYYGDALVGQNIALTPLKPGTVSGKVTDKVTGLPVAGATVTFVPLKQYGTQTFTATTGPDGSYSISATAMNPKQIAAASYNGSATGPNNTNNKPEYTAAAAPVTGNPVVVPPGGAPPTPINFVLTPIAPTITGTVTDSTTGTAIAGATVTITPVTAAGTPVAGGTVTTVTTDAAGSYASGPLTPGNYTVTATAPAYFDGATTAPLVLMLGDAVVQPFALGEKATLFGLITDASTGSPLSGVTITIADAITGVSATTVPASVITTVTTTAGPDGQRYNYLLNVAPGAYKVTAAKANYVSQTSASVTLTNKAPVRQDFKLLSTIGSLGGLVTNSTDSTPIAGVTVTVTDANKNTVAVFSTTGSSSTAPDGGQANYLGSLGQGTYTVTITQGARKPVSKTVTILGGQFNRLDFTGATGGLLPLITFPGGRLSFLSTPYDYSAVGFDNLFGNLNTAPSGTTANGNRSHVAVWDPLQSAYALDPNPPADALRLGVGYWIFLKNPVNITQQGASPTQPYVPVTLHPYWNQIGVANPAGIPVSNLMFDNGSGGKITFAQAVGTQYHIVSPTLYRFDGVGYQPVVAGDTLLPWQAYWMKVFVGATLEIPTGAGTTTTTTTGTTTTTTPTIP